MATSSNPLNSKGVDAIQSLKKTYNPCNETHRVMCIGTDYNSVVNTYNADGTIATKVFKYDSTAEVTTVKFNADCCGSLDGTSFNIYSGKNTKHYIPWYNLGTAAPCDTCALTYICIAPSNNDCAVVIAEATRLAFVAHCCAACDFIVSRIDCVLTFTATTKGATTNTSDVDTCFCICVTTNGLTCTVETVTYTYDCCGNLLSYCFSSQSNKNLIEEILPNLEVPCGVKSTLNSSTTPLAACCATFTGTGEQNNYPHVGIVLKTDQPGVLYFDFSPDGTNWDSTFPVAGFQISANVAEFHTAVKLGRYFRVRLVNTGCCAQTFLRLYTYYGKNFTTANQPLNQAIGVDTDAVVTRPTNACDEIVIGLRSRVRHFNKIAKRTNLTAACGFQTIWSASGNFTPMTCASTFTITYCACNCGSSACATGAKTLYVDYIDSCGLYAVETHVLGCTGSDTTSFSGLGINRSAVITNGGATYNNAAITFTGTCCCNIQAHIPSQSSVTQHGIFHTDSNSFGVIKYLWFNINKLSGSSPKVALRGYIYNRQFNTRYDIFDATIDTAVVNFLNVGEIVGFRTSPTDVVYFVADTDTNSTIVNMRFGIREYKQS